MEMTLKQKVDKALQLIRETARQYPNFSVAFSGGKDSTVLLYLVGIALGGHVRKTLRVDAILSDTEFDETHAFIAEFERAYQFEIRRHFYINDPAKPENASRENKVEKFKTVMADVDMWMSGIRRDEGATRVEIKDVEETDGLVKVNPIADFTETDVWRFLAIYHIPVNKAYRDGYRSLSCKLSSTPEERGDEPERGGRWKGSTCEAGECGIHSQSLRK
jgi:phosphoadenosine phosphosulfate reductase